MKSRHFAVEKEVEYLHIMYRISVPVDMYMSVCVVSWVHRGHICTVYLDGVVTCSNSWPQRLSGSCLANATFAGGWLSEGNDVLMKCLFSKPLKSAAALKEELACAVQDGHLALAEEHWFNAKQAFYHALDILDSAAPQVG